MNILPHYIFKLLIEIAFKKLNYTSLVTSYYHGMVIPWTNQYIQTSNCNRANQLLTNFHHPLLTLFWGLCINRQFHNFLSQDALQFRICWPGFWPFSSGLLAYSFSFPLLHFIYDEMYRSINCMNSVSRCDQSII